MAKILFVCRMGKARSVTGAKIYRNYGHDTMPIGIEWKYLNKRELAKDFDWVVVMEEYMAKPFPKKKTIILDIDDTYGKDQKELQTILKNHPKLAFLRTRTKPCGCQ